jgi:selenocysteine lyase/cysteine desulfurase
MPLASLDLAATFPHASEGAYLNHAAIGPLPAPTVEAVRRFLSERGGSDVENFEAVMPVWERAKERVARLIGADAARVEFAPNTSYALNVLAQGLRWRPGDRVAVPACEFPANVFPFLALQRAGVEVDFIPAREGTFTAEDAARTLRAETRVLSVSFVQYLSGFRADLAVLGQLCRERGVIFCVDAIQGIGALRLDVGECGVDFLACGGHKWLMSMQGQGFLYASEAAQEQIDAPAGWLHGPVDWDRLDAFDLRYHDTAERFRLGTLNSAGIVALDASLALYEQVGAEAAEARVLDLAERLAAGLRDLGMERYGGAAAAGSGIVTVKHERPEALFEHLRRSRVQVALRNRLLRFSPHWYTSDEDLDAALGAVAAFTG